MDARLLSCHLIEKNEERKEKAKQSNDLTSFQQKNSQKAVIVTICQNLENAKNDEKWMISYIKLK